MKLMTTVEFVLIVQKNHMLNSNPQCEGIWMWGLWEVIGDRLGRQGGALMMGLVTLQEEEETQDPLSEPCENEK